VVLNGVHAFDNKYGGLNPAATVPPTKARATHIKLKPYDDGTANDADEFFTSGSYVFEGTRL
jgi:hypothetical protein